MPTTISDIGPHLTAEDLLHDITTGGFHLQFQPIIQLQTQKIIGLEALMRWNHSIYGAIPPLTFVPLSHQWGLGLEISKFALTRSCRALSKLQKSVGLDRDLYMSVNFTSNDFADENFIDNIYMALSQTDLHPRKLRLELLESVMLNDQSNAIRTLTMCRQTGMGITVDNYGTSREFAESLHLYPVDAVKIAPSLVRSMLSDNSTYDLIAALTEHARNLGIKVSAVGIEKIEEAHALQSMGCELAQGYMFSPPLNEPALMSLFLSEGDQLQYA